MKIPGNSLDHVINNDKNLSAKGPSVLSAQGAVKSDVTKPPAQTAQTDKSSLVSQLKLPQDNLSRSIITFARFFSLPLETKLLSALRQDALKAMVKTPLKAMPGSSGGAAAQGTNQAAALGAAAAASKGIKLTEKALAEYAAAIEGRPESFSRETRHTEKNHAARQPGAPEDDAENGHFDQGDGSTPEGEGDGGAGFQNGSPNSGFKDHHSEKTGNQAGLSAKELQSRITGLLQEKFPLDLINRIPCKNGRWIVIPFSFQDKGFEFTVSLRIFLYEGSSKTGGVLILERLDADIKVTRPENCLGQEQRRWLISLKKSEEDFWAECTVFSGSEPWNFSTAEKKYLRQELAAALGLPLNRVSIKEEDFFIAESGKITLESVNEQV